MKIISAEKIAFAQGLHQDNCLDVLKHIRDNSTGVDKIARVRKINRGDSDTILDTFWFKGHNGKQEIRYTYQTVIN